MSSGRCSFRLNRSSFSANASVRRVTRSAVRRSGCKASCAPAEVNRSGGAVISTSDFTVRSSSVMVAKTAILKNTPCSLSADSTLGSSKGESVPLTSSPDPPSSSASPSSSSISWSPSSSPSSSSPLSSSSSSSSSISMTSGSFAGGGRAA